MKVSLKKIVPVAVAGLVLAGCALVIQSESASREAKRNRW